MGVEAEILAQPKVHYFCTDFSFGKGHDIRNRDDSFNTFASGLSFSYSADSDISTCSEENADKFFSSRPPGPDGEAEGTSPDPESLAQTLEKSLGLNNGQADNADVLNEELKDKLVITNLRPNKIPDCIATDDEDWEPPVWHAWDEWDQKVNAQEDWTWHNTLKYKARKGQFDDHDKVYKKKSKKRRHHHKSSRTENKTPTLP